MSRMQINIGQSELLMAIRCILNCQNDDIVANITELKERDWNDESIKQALFEAGYESARNELQELIERNVAKKISNSGAFDRCPECEFVIEYCWYQFCPTCGQRLRSE